MDNEAPLVEEKGAPRSPATPVSVRHHRKKSERSCLLCHQRKIRCDRMVPCTHCVRADILCCYPPSERVSRRPPKTTIADVTARLARLERTVTAISNGASSCGPRSGLDSTSTITSAHGAEVGVSESPMAVGSPNELIVQDGYSSRYINEALLSRVLEEVGLCLPDPQLLLNQCL